MDNHQEEVRLNVENWKRKPVLREIYKSYHVLISRHISPAIPGFLVEIGSGIGNIKEVLPDCLRTDMFPNPWLDRVENAYMLSFKDQSVSHLILFDVFHHLRYPGTALSEFLRVLIKGGRVIIFEPNISVFGLLIYGLGHPEPVSMCKPIAWEAPKGWIPTSNDYYAASGNASRVFRYGKYLPLLSKWKVTDKQYFSAFSYVASGGYSKPQLYPDAWFPAMRKVDEILDLFPALFATRLLVVLEKL
jgi:SAM-dependent methyltransferase